MDNDQNQESDVSQQTAERGGAAKPSSTLAWLALVVAIVACAGIAWQYYQRQHQDRHSYQQLVTDLKAAEQRLANQVAEQQGEIAAIEAGMNQFRLSAKTDTDSLILVELNHMARLADYHTLVDQNPTIALKILQQATKRANLLQAPELRQVKQALANSVASMQTVKPVPVEKIVLRLNALSKTLGELPLDDAYVPGADEKPDQQADKPAWKQHLDKNIERLKSVVSIRHLDKPSQAILPPAQHASLIEAIQLQMSMAQSAVLQRKPEIYQQSLDQAILYIKQYLRETTATNAIAQGLKELKKIDIAPKMPSLAVLVKTIDAAISSHHPQSSATTREAPPTTPTVPGAIKPTTPQVLSS